MVTFLDVGEPPRRADAVLILPGSEDARPEMAAKLIQAGLAQTVLIPETSRPTDPPTAPGFASTERNVKILLRRGVAASQIHVIDGLSTSTHGDAEALSRYLQSFPLADVTVVTDAWHSRRAQIAFRHALAGGSTQVHFCTVPNRFDSQGWWVSQSTRNGILKEWGKLLCYVMIYGHGWRWSVFLVLFCVTISAARRYANQCRAKESKHVGVRNQ
ncbi:MAG: YdcF family protein [Planctomycetaceae bacterium]